MTDTSNEVPRAKEQFERKEKAMARTGASTSHLACIPQ
jgi:hypothetical protein